MTRYNSIANCSLLKSICENDETGIFEAIARVSLDHGMPYENLSGFMVDLIGAINRWSENAKK